MMSKVLVFLALSMIIAYFGSCGVEARVKWRSEDIAEACTTNEDCKGRRVCNTQDNRCVKCMEDSDCRTDQFCFMNKCKLRAILGMLKNLHH